MRSFSTLQCILEGFTLVDRTKVNTLKMNCNVEIARVNGVNMATRLKPDVFKAK